MFDPKGSMANYITATEKLFARWELVNNALIPEATNINHFRSGFRTCEVGKYNEQASNWAIQPITYHHMKDRMQANDADFNVQVNVNKGTDCIMDCIIEARTN